MDASYGENAYASQMARYKEGEIVAVAQLISTEVCMSVDGKRTQLEEELNVRTFVLMVMNARQLTAEQRARLMHWRLSHCHFEVVLTTNVCCQNSHLSH